MGYPPQPHDPYGQQPQSPPGYGAPGYGYQPPTMPPPRPPKRSNTGLIVLLVVGLPLLLIGGCSALVLVLGSSTPKPTVVSVDPSDQPSAASSAPAEAAHEVVFEAVGSEGAVSAGNITYSVDFKIKQESGFPLPFTKELTFDGAQPSLYLWVQNAADKGTIECRIKIDGKVVREDKADGPYGVCTVKAAAAS